MKLKRLSLFLALVMILSAFAGTFTFTFAANTAGGTFEVWRGGEKVADVTTATSISAAVVAGTIVSGDTVKLTGNYTSNGVEQDGLTINLTIDGQGYTMENGTTGGRFFNLGDNVSTVTDITFTVKNVTMKANNNSGFIQMNRPGEDVVFENVYLNFNSNATSGTGAVVMMHDDQTVSITNSKVTAKTNFINIRNTNQEVTITDTTIVASAVGASHALIRCEAAATGYKLDMERVVIDEISGSQGFTRVIASYPTDADVNIDDCSIFSRGGDSIFEMTGDSTSLTVNNSQLAQYAAGDILEIQKYNDASVGTNVTASFTDCVMLHGSTMPVISVESGSGANVTVTDSILKSASANTIKVIDDTVITLSGCRVFSNGASPVVATAAKVSLTKTSLVSNAADVPMLDDLAETTDIDGANGFYVTNDITAPTAETADEYAASVLLKPYRIATEANAYASGAFTGYYSNIANALSANKSATEVFIVGDHYTIGREAYTVSETVEEETVTYTINTITGVANAGGTKPVVSTTQRYTANVTIAMTCQNFEIVNTYDDCAIQINDGGVLTLDNMTVAANYNNGCLVLQRGSKVVINDSIIDAMSSYGVRFNDTAENKVPIAEITNSVLKASNGGSALIMISANGIANISENSRVIVDGATGININGKTLTLNGTEVTSSVTAGAMLEGASVRVLSEGKGGIEASGIRFESTLTAAQVTAAAATGATVSYGTVIFRKADLGTMTVAELVAAANADENDALKVAEIEANKGIITDGEGNKTIRAALVNIKTTNYAVDFGACAYIELTYGDGSTVRIYGAFDATNNVRSIAAVAQAALADTKTEAGVVDGYNYYNEIEEGVFSCYSDEQITILEAYAAARQD